MLSSPFSPKRFSIPLYMRQAETYVKDSVVLLGDAAHTIHPLAGMGVNLGLADVACLAELLQGQKNIRPSILQKYNGDRRCHNKAMALLMRTIQKGFASSSSMAIHARSLGGVFIQQYGLLNKLANAGASAVKY